MSTDTDLDRHLAALAPSPSGPPDVAEAWRRAQRPRVPPAAPLVVIAVLLAVGVVALVRGVAGGPTDLAQEVDVTSGSAAADPGGPLYVLGLDGNPLPAALDADWVRALLPADPVVRTAVEEAGLAFHVTTDVHGATCLLLTGVAEGVTGACSTDAVFDLRGHLPLEVVDGDHDPAPDVWAAVVPNGVATARMGSAVAVVEENVVVFTDPPGGAEEVVLEGPAGTSTVRVAASLEPDGGGPYPTAAVPEGADRSALDDQGCVDPSAGTAAVDEALRTSGTAVWWRWSGATEDLGDGVVGGYGHVRSAAPFGAVESLTTIRPEEGSGVPEDQLVPSATRSVSGAHDALCTTGAADPAEGLDTAAGVAVSWVKALDAGRVDQLRSLTAGGVIPGDTMEAFVEGFGVDPGPEGRDIQVVSSAPHPSTGAEPAHLVVLDVAGVRTEVELVGEGPWAVSDVQVGN